MKRLLVVGMFVGLVNVHAEESGVALDRTPTALKRGAEVVTSVCMSCHSLRYVKYRDLKQVGMSAAEIDALRGTASLDDALMSATSDDMAVSTYGLVPPDQSLLAKAREGGAQYIYRFVTGYENDKNGNPQNRVFPGARMPDILGFATATPAEQEKLRQQARDAAVFLEWAADPRAGERRSLGYYVLAYLAVLTFLLFLLKERIWRQLPPPTGNLG